MGIDVTLPIVGGDLGQWGTILNQAVQDVADGAATPADVTTAVEGLGLGTASTKATAFFAQQLKIYSAVDNVLGINLVGDGTTNNQPNLQALVNAVSASGGGHIYFPTGTYIVADHGVLWHGNVGIVGDGTGKTAIKYTNAGTGLPVSLIWTTFQSQASFANPISDVVFRDFTIDGSAITGSYSVGMKGLNFQFCRNVLFSNIYIVGTGATGFGCDFLLNCSVEHVVAVNCGRLNGGTNPGGGGLGIGVGGYRSLNQTVADATFTAGSNVLTSATSGFPTSSWSETLSSQPLVGALVTSTAVPANTTVVAVLSATQLQLSANATSTGTASAALTYTNSFEYLNTQFIGCVSQGSGYKGLFFEAQSTNADFPKSKGIKVLGGSFTGGILGIADWGCDGLVVVGADLSGNSLDGFNVSTGGVVGQIGQNGRVTDCHIRGNGRDGVHFADCAYDATSGYEIDSNRIYGNTGHGVGITVTTTSNNARYIRVVNNRVGANGGCGVHTDSSCDRLQVQGNQIFNNGQNAALTQAQRAAVGIESTPTGISVVGNRMFDDQGSKTQQNAFYWASASSPNSLDLYDNDGAGNANSSFNITSGGCFAFPNVTPGPSGSVGGNVGSIFVGNGGLNNGQATVSVSSGNTPASGSAYRVGAQAEQLWYSVSGGTMTALKIGATATMPGLFGGVTSYGPINAGPNDGVIATYTGTLSITARPQ